MAVQQGYGKIAGANSLVFAYDTGDTRNSYKGEPTENMITGNMNTSGPASLGSDDQGDYIQLGNNTSGYAAIVVPNIYIPSGVTYTWSFELKASETFTSNFSWDTNEYSDQYPNSNDNSRVTYNHSTPTMVANEWVQYRLTVVMKDGLTNARSGDFFRFFFPTFQNKKIYYRNVQFELKDHITAYAGLGGSRSATEGLLDLTGNSSVDLSNVSFDANAQMTFDGASDYVDLGTDVIISPDNQGWTAEYWFNTNSASTLQHFNSAENDGFNANWLAIYNSKLAVWNRSPGYWKYGDTIIQSNTWYQAVFICDPGGTNYRYYINGVREGGDHVGNVWNATYSSLECRYIGRYEYNGGYSRYFNGELPLVRMYNRALTDAEVFQNFNHSKTRFNIA